jgi:hypothetical protein
LLDGANDAHFGKLVSDPMDSKGGMHQYLATSTNVNIIKKPRTERPMSFGKLFSLS